MPTLKILIFPDPRLRTVATAVSSVDEKIKALVDSMLETMYEGKGIGLAATQVNVHKRIIVIDVSEEKNKPLVLINPLLEEIIEPDLILCPMLSFDSSGFRLGYGGGFYDRTIDYLSKRKSILTMGCGYSQQLSQKFLPKGTYDKSLDTVVTERGITFFGK